MVALAADRNTPMKAGDLREEPVAAATKIFAGALVMRDANGRITKGATALNCVGVGRAEALADNTAGAAGAINCRYRPGLFRFANSAAGDAIVQADVGKACYVVDDQTVAKTDGAGTRSKAGIVDSVDAQGVWVRFDEALTRAS